MTTVIDLYPPAKKKAWMKVGAFCEVRGEGSEVFRIDGVEDRTLYLVKLNGYDQGRESMTKCYRTWRSRQAEKDWPIRERALAKLTKEEKRVLGLT
jgi:hypothetical protein